LSLIKHKLLQMIHLNLFTYFTEKNSLVFNLSRSFGIFNLKNKLE